MAIGAHHEKIGAVIGKSAKQGITDDQIIAMCRRRLAFYSVARKGSSDLRSRQITGAAIFRIDPDDPDRSATLRSGSASKTARAASRRPFQATVTFRPNRAKRPEWGMINTGRPVSIASRSGTSSSAPSPTLDHVGSR